MSILYCEQDPAETESILLDFPAATVVQSNEQFVAFLDKPQDSRLSFDTIYLGCALGGVSVYRADADTDTAKAWGALAWLIENPHKVKVRRVRVICKDQDTAFAIEDLLLKDYSVNVLPIGGEFDEPGKPDTDQEAELA